MGRGLGEAVSFLAGACLPLLLALLPSVTMTECDHSKAKALLSLCVPHGRKLPVQSNHCCS